MIILNLFLLLIGMLFCEGNAWHGIVPLKSTRAEAEQILGEPMAGSVSRYGASYRTKTEKVNIVYSTGNCDLKPSNGWNIPELTVISVSVYPDVRPKFEKSKFDVPNLEIRKDPEITNLTYYTDEKMGLSIEVDTNENVINSVSYSPESKDNSRRCK